MKVSCQFYHSGDKKDQLLLCELQGLPHVLLPPADGQHPRRRLVLLRMSQQSHRPAQLQRVSESTVATSAPSPPLPWIPYDSLIASTGPFLCAISCRVCKIPYERENQFYSKPRGGVAQQDEWLIPGDRLLFLNDINLENAFLDATFQVLKGTARGLVQIGVVKPHPVSLNESATNGAPELQASFPPHH